MRLYTGTTKQFVVDSIQDRMAFRLKEAFIGYYGYKPGEGEIRSWRDSLRAMANVVQFAQLNEHGVAVEYELPGNSRRMDFFITGQDQQTRDNAVIVELKQWSGCEPTDAPNEVNTWLNGAMRDTLHPCIQVDRYREFLVDANAAFEDGDSPIALASCAYLHNYHLGATDPLNDAKFESVLQSSPLFDAEALESLVEFIGQRVRNGRNLTILDRIDRGPIRPSKKLLNHVAAVIKGDPQFVMLDEQLVVFDRILTDATKLIASGGKGAVLVRGGPGTGKSVVAMNLLAELAKLGHVVRYATGSGSFTKTMRKIVGSRAAVQFGYFSDCVGVPENSIDVLIGDEAHRLRAKTFDIYRPARRSERPQAEDVMRAARLSVFFLDDYQSVRNGEIGSSDHVREVAKRLSVPLLEYELEAQFRCAGSDAFVNWISHTLGVRKTANNIWTGAEGFEFRIVDSPAELRSLIRGRARDGASARLTAGFCWPWSKATLDGTLANDVKIGAFEMPWNAREDATKLAKGIPKAPFWASEPGGIDQIGCIYTAQGFEFDVVGVIWGLDLRYDLDKGAWVGDPTQSHDSGLNGSGERFVELVKNTYRVLLSRGMKGCYVCFIDKDTERFVRSRMEVAMASLPKVAERPSEYRPR